MPIDSKTKSDPQNTETDWERIERRLTGMFNYFVNEMPPPDGTSEFEYKRFLCNQRDEFLMLLKECVAQDRSIQRTAGMRISLGRFAHMIPDYKVKPAVGQSPMLKDFSVSEKHFNVGMNRGGSGIENTCPHTKEDGTPIMMIGVMYSDVERILYNDKEQKMFVRYTHISEDGKETKTVENITINGITEAGVQEFMRIAIAGGYTGNYASKA